MQLSVLDTRSPTHVPELLPELERLGFHRYWATEHHSETQSASPTIVAGLAAGITERMRVGTAGVLLRAASPLRVAEDFSTLELFFPNRIDLGIAGAMPTGVYADELQRDMSLASNEAYEERVRRLVDMVRTATVPGSMTRIGPQSETRARLWLCGTSVRAAQLAGSLGISFAFHHYLASANQRVTPGIRDAYRSSFASVDGSSPEMLVAAYGHCASSAELALAGWESYFGSSAPLPSFLGTPERVAAQLAELADGYAADEIAIDCFVPTFDARLDGLAQIKLAVDLLCGRAADAA